MVSVTPVNTGTMTIGFIHLDRKSDLTFDTMAWTTFNGYHYMINDLQYFISGIKLHAFSGNWLSIITDNGIHYVDGRNKTGMTWQLNDQIPEGIYDSLSFIFGLDEMENISNRFLNPPERDMFWPDVLGGGYHYMKINMQYEPVTGPSAPVPFMFHIGIGQMYQGNTMNPDSIIGFIQNWFRIDLPLGTEVRRNETVLVSIVMDVAKWFDGEYAFDFTSYPGSIMQSQQGLFEACRNGRNVFSVVKQ